MSNSGAPGVEEGGSQLRNPFVHELKFTLAEKIRVRLLSDIMLSLLFYS